MTAAAGNSPRGRADRPDGSRVGRCFPRGRRSRITLAARVGRGPPRASGRNGRSRRRSSWASPASCRWRPPAAWPSRSSKRLCDCGGRWSRHRSNAAATACWRSPRRNGLPSSLPRRRRPLCGCWPIRHLVPAADGSQRVGWAERSESHQSTHVNPCGTRCSAHPASFPGIVFAVGPEGGFTDEEVASALAAGWKTIDLGPRILRVETAALALAALAGGWR